MTKIFISEREYDFYISQGFTDEQLEVIEPMPSYTKSIQKQESEKKHYMKFQKGKR